MFISHQDPTVHLIYSQLSFIHRLLPFSSLCTLTVCLHKNTKVSVTLNAALDLFRFLWQLWDAKSISCLTKHTQKPTPPTQENIIHHIRRHTDPHSLVSSTYFLLHDRLTKKKETNNKSFIVFYQWLSSKIPCLWIKKSKGNLMHLQYFMKYTYL